jgi:hypothetical protein
VIGTDTQPQTADALMSKISITANAQRIPTDGIFVNSPANPESAVGAQNVQLPQSGITRIWFSPESARSITLKGYNFGKHIGQSGQQRSSR